jgi:hypothetical protein
MVEKGSKWIEGYICFSIPAAMLQEERTNLAREQFPSRLQRPRSCCTVEEGKSEARWNIAKQEGHLYLANQLGESVNSLPRALVRGWGKEFN